MNKDYWLKNVDWYLQPIPEASERQKPTDEEIRKWTDKVQPSRSGRIRNPVVLKMITYLQQKP